MLAPASAPAASLPDPSPAAPPPVPSPADQGEPSREVELPWELEEIAHRYRSSADPDERGEALLELGLSEDPRALEFLLAELERSDPAGYDPILNGVIQFGSRDAIPRLRALARAAPSIEARRSLEEAAEYLALPSLTELRRGELVPRSESEP